MVYFLKWSGFLQLERQEEEARRDLKRPVYKFPFFMYEFPSMNSPLYKQLERQEEEARRAMKRPRSRMGHTRNPKP